MTLLRVILTNDDGAWSEGFRRLARALRDAGIEASIFAPLGNWSGSSKSIGRGSSYPAYPVNVEGLEGYAIDAPPAACVALALNSGARYDMVVSGINHGPNLGFHDVLSSGTIGAALEAALNGLPGLAVSAYCESYSGECLEPVAKAVAELVSSVRDGFEPGTVVVINAPQPPWRGVKAVKPIPGAPRLGSRVAGFRAELEPKIHDKIYRGSPDDTDAGAILNGYIAVSGVRVRGSSLLSIQPGDPYLARLARSLYSSAKLWGISP